MTPTLFTAPQVVVAAGEHIDAGAVLVDDGLIAAVGSAHTLEESFGPCVHRVALPGVVVPGLVNAHTHLQYTSFAAVGRGTYSSFEEWSDVFDAEYVERGEEDWLATATEGVRHSLAHGTTCIGDVVTDEEAVPALDRCGLSGVAFFEVMGLTEAEWLAHGEAHVRSIIEAGTVTGPTRRGISPHAPYSLEMPAVRGCAALASELGCRLHTHLGESASEDEFYRSGSGALAVLVRDVIGWDWPILRAGGSGLGTAEYAESLGLVVETASVAHGIYLGADGRERLREHGVAVVLCPRSNATIGLDAPPVADYLRECSPIAVGTDSLGSSPSLDLLGETAALAVLASDQGYYEDDLELRLFEAVTLGGARSLGLDHLVGSIEVGKRADFAVFGLMPSPRIEYTLVRSGSGRCTGTVIGGAWSPTGVEAGQTRPR